MKLTNLTKRNNKNTPLIRMLHLKGYLVIEKGASRLTSKECILIYGNKEYIFESIEYNLDVMYFKFYNEYSNCIVL